MDDAPGRTDDESGHSTPPRRKPRVWTVFVAVVLALLAAIVWQIVVTLVVLVPDMSPGVNPQALTQSLMEKLATPTMFVLMSVGGQFAFGAGALIAARLSPERWRERVGWLPVSKSRSVYPLAMLGSLAPLAVGFALVEALPAWIPTDPTFAAMFENLTLAASVPFVLYIALAPGICEELMFRGYVQRRLLQRWRPAPAICVSSVLFGLMHVTPHGIAVALPLGLWFGVVAWRCGSIGPGIACHAFVNGSVNVWRVVVKFADIPESLQDVVLALCLLVGVACFVVLVRSFSRRETGSPQVTPDRDPEQSPDIRSEQ